MQTKDNIRQLLARCKSVYAFYPAMKIKADYSYFEMVTISSNSLEMIDWLSQKGLIGERSNSNGQYILKLKTID